MAISILDPGWRYRFECGPCTVGSETRDGRLSAVIGGRHRSSAGDWSTIPPTRFSSLGVGVGSLDDERKNTTSSEHPLSHSEATVGWVG